MDNKIYQTLIDAARKAVDRSYSPYSNFAVGAAVLAEDGSIVTAANVENASYGLTICAERAAIFRYIAENHRRIRAIAVVSRAGGPCYPCGACRQVISEFANDKTEIVVEGSTPGDVTVARIADLLPHAFGPNDLKDIPAQHIQQRQVAKRN